MMNLTNKIESQLAKRFNRKCCVLTGSGTAAIYLLLESLHLKKDATVLLPGICCFAPAYAVKYAGLKLDFCDVSLLDGCLTAKSVAVALKKNPKIKVVIGVHLYGNVMKINSISKVCKSCNVLFIEDACQAYGSQFNGRPCGSFGDFSILSFGHTKILDAGGLGALLTDNKEVAGLVRNKLKKIVNKDPERSAELFDNHRQKYYAVQKKARSNIKEKAKFGELWKGRKDAFICGINKPMLGKIEALLKQEGRIIAHRKKLNLMYNRMLQRQAGLKIVKSKYRAVPWRFSCLIKNRNLPQLCDVMRSCGYDISNWYPNLANMFVQDYRRKLKNADEFEKNVVNMWVDETKDAKYVIHSCQLLEELL